jgi:hypothetical protein
MPANIATAIWVSRCRRWQQSSKTTSVPIPKIDPHSHAHGTFSFDIANGVCGVLTALQIADGLLRSRTYDDVSLAA